MADYTVSSVIFNYALMVLFAGGALLVLVAAIRTGAVSGGEEAKLRMMEDDE